jgi:hypothetical protein
MIFFFEVEIDVKHCPFCHVSDSHMVLEMFYLVDDAVPGISANCQ